MNPIVIVGVLAALAAAGAILVLLRPVLGLRMPWPALAVTAATAILTIAIGRLLGAASLEFLIGVSAFTLPVILAFLRGGAVDREFWKRTIESLDQRDGDLAQAQSLIERHNALADTLERARHYGAMARDALGLFRDCPLKSALLEAVDFAIDRAH